MPIRCCLPLGHPGRLIAFSSPGGPPDSRCRQQCQWMPTDSTSPLEYRNTSHSCAKPLAGCSDADSDNDLGQNQVLMIGGSEQCGREDIIVAI